MPEIKINSVEHMRDKFTDSPRKLAVQNAIMKNGLKKSVTNQNYIDSKPFEFSIDVDSDKVLDQKKSGRCWIFSALNFLRFHIEKDFHIKNMQLSPNYIFFYDKLEKANYFYQNIIDTANKPLSDRDVYWLLQTPQQDGGDWYPLVSLFKKYGVVPKSVMDETAVSVDTSELNFVLNRKLQTDAIKLRKLVNDKASKQDIDEAVATMNDENYTVIASALGTPPKTFNYKYRDENNKFHSTGEITPLEFFKKFVKIDLDDYVELLNVPGEQYPFNQSYFIEYADNMVDGVHNRYLNLPMETLNQLAIAQLKDGEPVWYECDVLQEGYGEQRGLLGSKVFDWKNSLGINLNNDKTTRFEYHSSIPSHAMLVCGVDLDDDGKPLNWKIQNSWGPKVGHDGYYMMTNEWNNAYTYEFVVNKKYLTKDQLVAFNKKPVVLPYWNRINPM